MTDNGNEDASYTITRQTHIIELLMHMQKQSALIYVKPAAGAENGFMSSIIRILPDKNILAMEVSTDSQLNIALKNSGEILFSATVNGVVARFNAPALNTATLGGNLVFALPIPKSLYWQQRRHAYRMPIPLATPITCIIPLTDSNAHRFTVSNVSLTGILVFDENQFVAGTIEIGRAFHGCHFIGLSGIKDSFSLELRRISEVDAYGTARSGTVLGLHFVNTTFGFDKKIQDLLHEFAREKKRKSELTRSG